MAFADDFSVNAAGDIRHVSGTTNYPVIDLHRYLGGLADDAEASGDDVIDITTFTPSDRATDQIITLNDHSANSGPTFNIDDTAAQFLYGGSITQDSGASEERYSGLQIIGSFTAEPQVVQDNTILTGYWGTSYNPDATLGIAVQILVKTMTAGAIIDGGRVRVQTRNYGDQYREASTVLGLANSPAAPGNIQSDTFNDTLEATIGALTLDFATHASGGYNLIDLVNGSGAQPYASEWDLTTPGVSLKEFYEWIKWAQQDGSTEQLYGMDGELFRGITHEIAITPGTGTWVEPESLSWGTGATAGTGQLLAVDDTDATSTSKMWIQHLTGVVPSTNLITGNGSATGTAGTVTSRPIGVESAIGSYVGSLLGAYGVGVAAADLTNTDSVIDLDGDTETPPNLVTWTLEGLVIGEDYALVGPRTAGLLDTAQLALDGIHTGGETTVSMTTSIPSDTPTAGTFRVDDGTTFQRVTYTGFSGADFTGCSGMPAAANLADVFISYLDKLAAAVDENFQFIYDVSDRPLFVRVRDGGGTPIKTFESPSSVGVSGGGVTVIRTPDV